MRWPAEWEPHEAVWIGFPGDPVEWPVGLVEAQQEVAAFANLIADQGQGEKVLLLCRSDGDATIARDLCPAFVSISVEYFGDIWLRDTGPVISVDSAKRRANIFQFNGWGGKFEMAGDQDIGLRLARSKAIDAQSHDWILEGGAIDGDGADWLVTTEQCVLNSNRNAQLSKVEFKHGIAAALGTKNVCWLGDGLINDHTDGHVDNLARFVAVGTVAIPRAESPDDPNATIFEQAMARAGAAGLKVVRVPSVGRYEIDGAIVPASYMNFYIGNNLIAVPQFDAANDSKAVTAIQSLFPDHRVVGLSSEALLRGGGSFHCISQQMPAI